jgi:hypothetical protein
MVRLHRFNIGKYHGRAVAFYLFSFYVKIELIYLRRNFNVKMEFGDWSE